MPWLRLARLAVCVCMLGVWACGDDDTPPKKDSGSGSDDGGDEFACVDEDGDGFGEYCDEGTDCDDQDPQVTDECRRCARPREGCACTPGADSLTCTPPDIRTAAGVLVCSEGTRYCRAGKWSSCEAIGEYRLVSNE